MKLPIYKRINREDLKDAPDWIGNLLYPLNQVFETVYNTLNRNLTFTDNVLSFQKTIQFTTKSDYVSMSSWDVISIAIPDSFKVRVSGVITLNFAPIDTTLVKNITGFYLNWVENNRTVQIPWIGGLDDDTEYTLTVVVI